MIARTYYVVMPAAVGEATPGDLDIVVELPGTQAAPVATGNAPAGWVGATGSYYEIRARPLRLPVVVGDAGFVPRLNLGWSLSVMPYAAGAGVPHQLSASLQSSLDATALTDPSYGPVIRLKGSVETGEQQLVVNLLVMEQKDEDRNAAGV
jgi:hypothetical protein